MRFNSRGEYHGGRVGIGSWLNDDTWLTQADVQSAWLACGGDRWVDSTQTCRSNFGYAYPPGLIAKVWDMALDGTVVEVPNYHMPYSAGVWPAREEYQEFDEPVRFARAGVGGACCVLVGYQRVWSNRHGWIQLPAGIQAFEIALCGNVLCFTTHAHTVLLNVSTGLGRRMLDSTFYPDLFAQPDGVILGYGTNMDDVNPQVLTVPFAFLTEDLSTLSDATIPPEPEPPDPEPPEPEPPEPPEPEPEPPEPEPVPEPPPTPIPPPPGGRDMGTIQLSEPFYLNWRYGGGQSLDPPTQPADPNRDPFEHGRETAGADETAQLFQFADGTYGIKSPNGRSWLSIQGDGSYEERPATDDAEPGPWERFTLTGNVLTELPKEDATRAPVTFVQP
jgi:hypothetical protein